MHRSRKQRTRATEQRRIKTSESSATTLQRHAATAVDALNCCVCAEIAIAPLLPSASCRGHVVCRPCLARLVWVRQFDDAAELRKLRAERRRQQQQSLLPSFAAPRTAVSESRGADTCAGAATSINAFATASLRWDDDASLKLPAVPCPMCRAAVTLSDGDNCLATAEVAAGDLAMLDKMSHLDPRRLACELLLRAVPQRIAMMRLEIHIAPRELARRRAAFEAAERQLLAAIASGAHPSACVGLLDSAESASAEQNASMRMVSKGGYMLRAAPTIRVGATTRVPAARAYDDGDDGDDDWCHHVPSLATIVKQKKRSHDASAARRTEPTRSFALPRLL
jgi:hypothetical protein